MTAMPAAVAVATDDLIAVPSWARMIRTVAPPEIRFRVVSLPAGVGRAAMRVTGALGLSPLAPYHWLMYGESFYFDIGRAELLTPT